MASLVTDFFRKCLRRKHEDADTTAAPQGFLPIENRLPDDLYIIGFPKSGHTWTQNLVAEALYGFNGDPTPVGLIRDLVPDLHSRPCYRRYRSPMFFKAHALPAPEFKRVVYLLRDGRDAMVSYRHYLSATEGRAIDFLHLVKTGEGLFPCKWHEHVSQWRANPFRASILFVRYEDLVEDTSCQLGRILSFAGIHRSSGQLETAVRRSSFANMQEREKEHGTEHPRWPTDRLFVRRGKVGSYQDEMPVEVQEAFLAEAAAVMRHVGYLPVGPGSRDHANATVPEELQTSAGITA